MKDKFTFPVVDNIITIKHIHYLQKKHKKYKKPRDVSHHLNERTPVTEKRYRRRTA